MKELNTTCIMCPMGCQLKITQDGENVTVTGNTCKRGEMYGKQELVSPKRVVTSLVRIKDGAVVSVKTNDVVDKSKMFDILEELRKVQVELPVNIGDVIIKNVCNTGVDIVATSKRD